ncbi:hypothetical protein LTS12_026280 [Elasticomyces elasticus]|nr:hypothetical protein LTS12_026280 [Elasticomyces elasticus]
MACETASSPFSEHRIEDSWMKTTEHGNGFDALAEFNTTFGGGSNHGTIDPHMLSNPPSPANSFTSDFHIPGVDQTMSPQASNGLGIYPHDFGSPHAPYYSTDSHHTTGTSSFTSSGMRHEFRRSVSEPPGGLPLQHVQMHNNGPQMTFNRNGHFIGNLQPPQLQRLKSLPKSKSARSQPYKTKMSGQQRYQLRRTQTQPVRQHTAPTSTPSMMAPPSSHPHPYPPALGPAFSPHMVGHQVFEPLPTVPEQRSYISSRVCTPTPDEVSGGQSQQAIDPMLTAPPTPADRQDKAVTVALTVDQLKSMITEAVQKAVRGLGSKVEESASENVALESDELVVQSIEGAQAGGEVTGEGSDVVKVEKAVSPTTEQSEQDDLDSLFVV